MEQYYYSTATLQTYSAYQMQGLFGINVETTDVSILNQDGFYPVVASDPSFDVLLYDPVVSYVISGTNADMVWTPVAKPLATAQENGVAQVKGNAGAATTEILAANNISNEVMTSVASQLVGDRPADLQAIMAEMQVVSDLLGTQIAAINAATTVDEINDIVNPSTSITGSLDLYRTGNNLNQSYVTSITGCDPDQLSLYFNATGTTVAYDPGIFAFPATSSVFSGGDFTGSVKYLGLFTIATFNFTGTAVTVPINWTP